MAKWMVYSTAGLCAGMMEDSLSAAIQAVIGLRNVVSRESLIPSTLDQAPAWIKGREVPGT